MNELNLKAGVLIIGSLLWQDHKEIADEDNIRKEWREENLHLDQKIMVKVPIRYGRLSNGIYTMTFSNSCKTKKGTGYFVPFKKEIFETFEELVDVVMKTSLAEGMNEKFISKKNGTEEIWSVMGLLLNPNTIIEEKKVTIVEKWNDKISSQRNHDPTIFRVGKEKACIDRKGRLNIDWIKPVDDKDVNKMNSYDVVIAATTKPTDYPSIEELKNNVRTDTIRRYFINNYKSGITTFQDIKVLNKL